MSFGNALIAFLVLVAAVNLFLFFRRRRRWGSFQGLVVLRPQKAGRTRGEIDRELWEQKGAMDRAIEATAAGTVARHQAATAGPASWHAPDAPCEVEPVEVAAGPVRSPSMMTNPTNGQGR